MQFLTSKHENLSSNFEKNNEKEIIKTLKQILNNNHDTAENRSKKKLISTRNIIWIL